MPPDSCFNIQDQLLCTWTGSSWNPKNCLLMFQIRNKIWPELCHKCFFLCSNSTFNQFPTREILIITIIYRWCLIADEWRCGIMRENRFEGEPSFEHKEFCWPIDSGDTQAILINMSILANVGWELIALLTFDHHSHANKASKAVSKHMAACEMESCVIERIMFHREKRDLWGSDRETKETDRLKRTKRAGEMNERSYLTVLDHVIIHLKICHHLFTLMSLQTLLSFEKQRDVLKNVS